MENRQEWIDLLIKVAHPVWENAASGTLRKNMPVEARDGFYDACYSYTHFEAIGRSLAGIAPWLECPETTPEETPQRDALYETVKKGLEAVNQPDSPDRLNYHEGAHPLVDGAFVALGLLRAPSLWNALDPGTKRHIIEGLIATRRCPAHFNNWLLFVGIIEAFLGKHGEACDLVRLDFALRQHEQWYVGDGHYQDGIHYACDYYNSYVIHPMLVEIIDATGDFTDRWHCLRDGIHARASKYAQFQESMIASDGSFPPLGRSLTYRCGAFHALAQSALRGSLPDAVQPSQARRALGSVIRKTLTHPETFDPEGWLRIGVCGHQPEMGEDYVATGSLYMCLCAFLPLGLGPTDPFWSGSASPTSQKRLFG